MDRHKEPHTLEPFKNIPVRLRISKAQAFEDYCKRHGTTPNAKLKELIDECLKKDKPIPGYDPRPFWEKFDEPELRQAVLQEYQWEKTNGYRSNYYDTVTQAYKRRFGGLPTDLKGGM